MGIWYTEKQTESFGITAKIKQTHASEQTDFQQLQMVETEEWGNMLILDDRLMTTEKDEFVYHEMLAHVPLFTHPDPKDVLIVGNGNGGVIREVLKHPSVKKVTLVEIDGKVIDYSKKYLPAIASGFDNERVEVKVEDGFMYIANSEKAFDVILVDSTEPVGPAVNLFSQGFYAGISKALKDDGVFAQQTDNPWFKADLIRQFFNDVKKVFPVTRLYTANIPTYPSGLWTFTMGSKIHNPLKVKKDRFTAMETKYYTPELHFASFVLPKFVKELTE